MQTSPAHAYAASRPQAAPPSRANPPPTERLDEVQRADRDADRQTTRGISAVTELTESEKQDIERLKARDREVRDHERAHSSAGGRYAGSASYEYETGPDGHAYAVGGEVPIEVAPVPGDPEATIAKSQQVKRAALAPNDPSGADRQIAAKADAQIREARAQALDSEPEAAPANTPETAANATGDADPKTSGLDATGRQAARDTPLSGAADPRVAGSSDPSARNTARETQASGAAAAVANIYGVSVGVAPSGRILSLQA